MMSFLGNSQVSLHSRCCPVATPCPCILQPGSTVHQPSSALPQQLGSVSGPQLTAKTPVCRHAKRTQVKTQAGIFGNLTSMFNKDGGKVRRQMQPLVDKVNALEPEMQSLSDKQLRGKTDEFKQRIQQGSSLDDLLVEAFAVVREASSRVLGLRPFDVQLIGGMVLHGGQIAEMKTGEGKTLVAVLPAYLNALAGKGVQVVTVNDYLARRDSEWVGQVHRFLGLTVGLVQTNLNQEERRQAYASDVTYVTNSELGFDYLRENLATTKEELVLRGFDYCIIDEVDSILIDEARTPLIISGQSDKPSNKYEMTQKLASALERDYHYTVDEKQKNILLTEDGYEAAEQVLNVVDLYDPREQWASYLINAIKAKELQKRDVNYIVRGSEIVIVDEFTGRTMPGRRWSDGLHQAVEAKEAVEIQNETITMASISYQNFFRGYKKKSGMTGTAATETAEFSNIYELTTSVVPPNRPNVRKDNSDVVFKSTEGKWSAVVQEIARMHSKGRPVLVGTTSVEQSEDLARRLDEEDIKYQLLNAKPENVERESEIVAQSGRKGAVTIATNMAGRGTDIILGGNAEFQARLKLREMLMPEIVNQAAALEGSGNGKARAEVPNRTGKSKTWKVAPEIFPRELSGSAKQIAQEAVKAAKKQWGERQLEELEAEERLAVVCEKGPVQDPIISQLREAFQIMEAEYKEVTETERAEVVELGGLHVIGTERHESRRIDNQLRGRGGRQGDPGSTRFFLSLEDPLFRVFGGERIQGLMKMFQIEDLPIESGMLTNALNEAQRKVESYFFDIRRQLFDYDMVLNTQRERVYTERRRALLATDLSQQLVEYAERTVDDILEANVDASLPPEQWDLNQLASKMKQYCYLLEDLTGDALQQQAGGDFEALRSCLRQRAVDAYWTKVQEVDNIEPGLMQEAQRFFVLTQTDSRWKEHLQAIKFLQQAVGLRGYAQRDPLTEYKLEGYNLFLEMMAQIRRNVIYNVYCFQPKPQVQEQYRARQAAQAKSKKEPAAAGGRRR